MNFYRIVQIEREWRVVETTPARPSRIVCRSRSEACAQVWLVNRMAEINLAQLMRWAGERGRTEGKAPFLRAG